MRNSKSEDKIFLRNYLVSSAMSGCWWMGDARVEPGANCQLINNVDDYSSSADTPPPAYQAQDPNTSPQSTIHDANSADGQPMDTSMAPPNTTPASGK